MLLIPELHTPDIPNWVTLIGAGVGSAIAAFIANRARKASDKSAASVQQVCTDLNGPVDEPSLRELIKDHQQQASDNFVRLHGDSVRQAIGLEALKETVSKDIDGRLRILETSTSSHALAVSAIQSLDARVNQVTAAVERNGVNMHVIANHVQCKLLTPEETSEILKKRADERALVEKAQTKQP